MSATHHLDPFLAGYLVALGFSANHISKVIGISRYAVEQSAATAKQDRHQIALFQRFLELWNLASSQLQQPHDGPDSASEDLKREIVDLRLRISEGQATCAARGEDHGMSTSVFTSRIENISGRRRGIGSFRVVYTDHIRAEKD